MLLEFDKKEFLASEFGMELQLCIKSLAKSLANCNKYSEGDEQYAKSKKLASWAMAQWEIFQIAIKHFYGLQYEFTHTNGYYGLLLKDGSDWLIQIKEPSG